MSVSGVRGIIGDSMTPTLAAELGMAFGAHLDSGTVVVGRDSRPSGPMVQSALVGGLLSAGCKVVELGIVSTPGTALMIGELSAAGGVVITASHNPVQWNGIKFLTAQGCAPSPEVAESIFAAYRQKNFPLADVDRIGTIERDHSTHDQHLARVSRVVNVEAIRRRQLKVVLDSINGAGGVGGKMLLEHLGCRVVHINAEPHGRFAHTPEPTAENLTSLCSAVLENGADLGFAQDPDADRLAVVDNKGRYIGEEYTLVLAAKQVLSQHPGPVAVNLSTSRMIDDLVAQVGQGASVIRTAVGEANVVHAMLEHNCVLGGEGNGGVIDPRVVFVRDSFVAMGLVLNLLAGDWRPLSNVVDDLPSYVMLKQKVDLDRGGMKSWMDRVRMSVQGQMNNADGLRIDWPEGWVHVRPSNTEPIARIISEAKDAETARALAKRVTELR